jgi:hypothetical protein
LKVKILEEYQKLLWAICLKWIFFEEHEIQDAAQTPNINFVIIVFSLENFWSCENLRSTKTVLNLLELYDAI